LADDARVTLLHVVPGNLRPSEQRDAERDANKALAVEARHLHKTLPKNVSIEPLVKFGDAAKEIAACAKKVQADLIVMGRSGRRALRDAFLGSTAERVVRQARLPVLVVRLPARSSYSRPALALDLDQAAHEIVRLMLLIPPPPRPRAAVIHAYDIPYRGMIYPSLSAHESGQLKDDLRLTAFRKLNKLLTMALSEVKLPSEHTPAWRTHVRFGSPRSVVEKATRKADTDLLVLGTRGYSGPAYVFLGTIAGDLLREAKCDVLVVPPAPSRRSGKPHIRDRGAD
jgi:nucleotide-binding universal stress UspA family protein